MREESGAIPPATDAVFHGVPDSLGVRERATAEELTLLDPQLGGLYRLGHELARRDDEPGLVYLLAHAGREPGRGVVQRLAVEGDQASTLPDDVAENESNRRTIAPILQLAPNHPTVTTWFHLINVFSWACHYRVVEPSLEKIRTSFLRFSALLYGRVGPYLATHAELDRFLAIEEPSPEECEQAGKILLRPQQRRYFFAQLQHPAWLAPLAEGGHFETPPGRLVEPDGRWRMPAWPPGDYLTRVAPLERV